MSETTTERAVHLYLNEGGITVRVWIDGLLDENFLDDSPTKEMCEIAEKAVARAAHDGSGTYAILHEETHYTCKVQIDPWGIELDAWEING